MLFFFDKKGPDPYLGSYGSGSTALLLIHVDGRSGSIQVIFTDQDDPITYGPNPVHCLQIMKKNSWKSP